MAMTAASAATMVLPLPTSPCSRRFMGCGACHVVGDLAEDAFLRAGGLEGQHGFDALADAVVEFERRCRGRARALLRFRATPHSSQKNSSKIRRNCAGERKALSRRRSDRAAGKWVSRMAVQRSGSLQAFARMRRAGDLRAASSDSRMRCMRVRRSARGDLAGGFVDGHDAAGVEGGFAFVVVTGEDFELGMHAW